MQTNTLQPISSNDTGGNSNVAGSSFAMTNEHAKLTKGSDFVPSFCDNNGVVKKT